MEFTFYGDLIGMKSIYSNDPMKAYQTLNEFYNTCFNIIPDQKINNCDMQTYMFSDSILLTGNNIVNDLPTIQKLYLRLLSKSTIMLRGAIVSGKLNFDPRIERSSFKKMLPIGTELVRAISLEGQYKGARLIIENKLAEELLDEARDWKTISGYVNNLTGDNYIPKNDFRRRIIPVPEGGAYEYLYFWELDNVNSLQNLFHKDIEDKLSEIEKYMDTNKARHYSETLNLLKRSLNRKKYTETRL
ncbi:hypothetical protein [Solidesulfovibrio magneticus]|uniref:Guanylate cyclase domain-containing protein n=1 Tax=Solidesulfovibrio magneticus (strain ATCC 700980 / DSM 13731 / RS-1) TaxID=573370 RepID=C4XTQ6_SOLM1|nr:hypothetical protein [Solidesulfovibrio magneticus]BAH73571.1 hypothetical protein DMR_00800 [Solidesulfovibrio magneticus RS-1]